MATDFSFLTNSGGDFIEDLYQSFLEDPNKVDASWRGFFEGFEFARASFSQDSPPLSENMHKEFNVINLINEYRNRGHLFTRTNPVRERRKYFPTLEIENFGLTKADLSKKFEAGKELKLGTVTLAEIVDFLQETYCDSVGSEYVYARNPEIINWLKSKIETTRAKPALELKDKKVILENLNRAVAFETFLGSKYVGQKRFSLEGAETLIPALDEIINLGADLGVEEYMIGMAHRGRLNVLANTLRKTYSDIFSEFEEKFSDDGVFDGDVKYHLGYATNQTTRNGKNVHLGLCPNPSHLESVAPVAIGNSRAKIDNKYKGDNNKLCPIIIHGDASIAGQGIVYEVTQMSELDAYQAGGSIHIVINNQVGFTTNYLDARSSTYCTDIAKVTLSPVFHVNGDDVEAVVYCSRLAMEFRQKFHKDVFIDLLCYRRHGHNEGDEPRFTQPDLYSIIEKHSNPREIYFKKLLERGAVEASLAKEMEKEFKKYLQARLNEVKQTTDVIEYTFQQSEWVGNTPDKFVKDKEIKTGVSQKDLLPLAKKLSSLPEGRNFYSKMIKIISNRAKMLETDKLDWAMGELLAYASLLKEGHNVRMTGQDCERGTFAHRHAVMHYDGTEKYVPLNDLGDKQGNFFVKNSFLSEYAVLGFEYGYSWSNPKNLVIWEAQFGDFVNGAQIIIDQYISSALTKWKRLSGLVMLLPHGYEGQGPEHSSARMERFLELCSGLNMQVVQPTTPANMFHLLRRQIHRAYKSPLVVFTPKSLLRHPKAVSSFKEMTSGSFQEVIDDSFIKKPSSVKRVLFCTGKIFYELQKVQEENNRKDVAIVRLEEIHPFPKEKVDGIISKYGPEAEYCWVQEEPENMGAWPYILRKMNAVSVRRISRKESSSTATGYKKQHLSQQKYIIENSFLFAGNENPIVKKKAETVRK